MTVEEFLETQQLLAKAREKGQLRGWPIAAVLVGCVAMLATRLPGGYGGALVLLGLCYLPPLKWLPRVVLGALLVLAALAYFFMFLLALGNLFIDLVLLTSMFTIGIWLLIFDWLNALAHRRLYQQDPHYHAEYSLEATPAALVHRGPNHESVVEWSGVQGMLEGKRVFVIQYSGTGFPVPKAAFQSPERIAQFRHLQSQGSPERLAIPVPMADLPEEPPLMEFQYHLSLAECLEGVELAATHLRDDKPKRGYFMMGISLILLAGFSIWFTKRVDAINVVALVVGLFGMADQIEKVYRRIFVTIYYHTNPQARVSVSVSVFHEGVAMNAFPVRGFMPWPLVRGGARGTTNHRAGRWEEWVRDPQN